MSANFQKLQALHRACLDKAKSRMAAVDKAEVDLAGRVTKTQLFESRRAGQTGCSRTPENAKQRNLTGPIQPLQPAHSPPHELPNHHHLSLSHHVWALPHPPAAAADLAPAHLLPPPPWLQSTSCRRPLGPSAPPVAAHPTPRPEAPPTAAPVPDAPNTAGPLAPTPHPLLATGAAAPIRVLRHGDARPSLPLPCCQIHNAHLRDPLPDPPVQVTPPHSPAWPGAPRLCPNSLLATARFITYYRISSEEVPCCTSASWARWRNSCVTPHGCTTLSHSPVSLFLIEAISSEQIHVHA
ncbi:vegetative cell wall protein gp1 [Triticum aestivum]|uniref:vegetative cell wall protein gp1 n=1 Tax=Triticum aestivum TaxID=4565 RepID=UPI001D016D11|nr:vegetative cell wall protein gp1-like [Triticum aestivum]